MQFGRLSPENLFPSALNPLFPAAAFEVHQDRDLMFPLFNSLPFQSNNSNPSSTPQVMGNQGNFVPYSAQNPQMGLQNPQTPIPFSNSNALFAPNQFFPMQVPQNFNNNNHPTMPMNQINNNMNNVPNPMAQFFSQNSVNPSQFLNQNLNFGMGFPYQLQNMNQNFPMQLPNLGVAGNFNLPQNLAFVASNQLGFGNANGLMQHPLNLNAMNQTPNASQKLQPVPGFAPFQPQQNTKNLQPLPPNSQGNNRNNDKMQRGGRNPGNKNFSRNGKHEMSGDRFTKSQFRNFQNTKGNFKPRPMQSRKGNSNDDGNKTPVVQKRSIPLNYTEQEIRQWREERRKNYPTNSNINKKLAAKAKEPSTADLEAKLRRQQLKEILAKQAELGCEVAEIPACYLSDSEKQVLDRKDNGRSFNKKGRFQNKFNKRGRFNKNDRFSKKGNSANHDTSGTLSQTYNLAKKQRIGNEDSVITRAPTKREPTLLQKLLSADIKRDKRQMLQAFRFMVMNSFFKDWPGKPLKFPIVVVNEFEVDAKVEVGESSKMEEEGEIID